jgi:hypothetical protein
MNDKLKQLILEAAKAGVCHGGRKLKGIPKTIKGAQGPPPGSAPTMAGTVSSMPA